MFDKPVLVLGQPEEIAFFPGFFNASAAVRTHAVHQLRFGPEGFTWCAIPALIFAYINISLVIQGFENLLNTCGMLFISRSDELVITYLHHLPKVLDAAYDPVHILL